MTDRVVDGQLHGLSIEHTCAALEWRLFRLRKRMVEAKEAKLRERVQHVLSDCRRHEYLDSEQLFSKLQAEYPVHAEYGFGTLPAWQRGVSRAATLLQFPGMAEPGRTVLEVGAGDGMVGRAMADYGHAVTLLDGDDWRDARARSLPFLQCDACADTSAEDGSYDLVYSFNSLEHFVDPAGALRQMERAARPGGLIFLSFGPLYWSAWGLHAFPSLRMPFAQMLFSRAFLDSKLRELGNYDLARTMYVLQPLNGWRAEEYVKLGLGPRVQVLEQRLGESTMHLDMVRRFPQAFRGLDLGFDDLVVQSIELLMRKAT